MKRTTLIMLNAMVLAAALSGCQSDTAKLIAEGVNSYQLGHLDRARAKLTQALDQDPCPDALFYLGRVHHAQGFYEQAIFYYQCCLEGAPAYPGASKFLRQAQRAAGAVGPALQIIPDLEED